MTRCAALALISVLAGCMADIGEDEDLTDIDFVSPVNPHVLGNGMQKTHVIGNGIMGTPGGLDALLNFPLHSDTFNPSTGPSELAGLAPTVENQVFIRHLVECALDATMELKWAGFVYQGAAGLATDWNFDKPTRDELEVVSACMGTLNNKLGISVILSMRGIDVFGNHLPITGAVRGFAYGPDPTGTKLASFFDNCSPFEIGHTRSCGWSEPNAWVGVCTPGATVDVGMGARVGNCGAPLGRAKGDTVIRACAGLRSCDNLGPGFLKSADNTCGKNPAVRFICPSDGTFNIMAAGRTQTTAFIARPEADSGSPFEFPTKAERVFPYNEATFFGNMFDKDFLNPNVRVVLNQDRQRPIIVVGKSKDGHTGLGDDQIFPLEDMWACHDPDWTAADAYLTSRLCSLVDVQPEGGGPMVQANFCLAQPVGPCNFTPADDPANLCRIYDQGPELGDFDRDECTDGRGNVRSMPITSFLHEPCDLIGEREKQLCGRK
jgi:hypothetical protein